MDRGTARNTLKILGEVKSAKEQYRAEVEAGSITMPSGLTADTLGTYTPTMSDLAPFIKAQGVEEGTVPTAAQLMTGTGQRTLVMNTLDTDPTCTPAIPAEFQIK